MLFTRFALNHAYLRPRTSNFVFPIFRLFSSDYSNCRNILSILFVTRRYIDELQLDSQKKNITENENCFWYARFCVKTQVAKYLKENY